MDSNLKNLLADVFGLRPSEITETLTKDDIDSWDSLKQMDLVMSLERTYNIQLDIRDIIQMVSVDSIINVIKKKGIKLEN